MWNVARLVPLASVVFPAPATQSLQNAAAKKSSNAWYDSSNLMSPAADASTCTRSVSVRVGVISADLVLLRVKLSDSPVYRILVRSGFAGVWPMVTSLT